LEPLPTLPAVTILFVEDNELVRKFVRELLEPEGWKVHTCEDGVSAMRKLESAERFDVIITDNWIVWT